EECRVAIVSNRVPYFLLFVLCVRNRSLLARVLHQAERIAGLTLGARFLAVLAGCGACGTGQWKQSRAADRELVAGPLAPNALHLLLDCFVLFRLREFNQRRRLDPAETARSCVRNTGVRGRKNCNSNNGSKTIHDSNPISLARIARCLASALPINADGTAQFHLAFLRRWRILGRTKMP